MGCDKFGLAPSLPPCCIKDGESYSRWRQSSDLGLPHKEMQCETGFPSPACPTLPDQYHSSEDTRRGSVAPGGERTGSGFKSTPFHSLALCHGTRHLTLCALFIFTSEVPEVMVLPHGAVIIS